MSRNIRGTIVHATFGVASGYREGQDFLANVEEDAEGQAVELVIEDAAGRMWLWSPNFATQVSYCPFSGRKARVAAEPWGVQ